MCVCVSNHLCNSLSLGIHQPHHNNALSFELKDCIDGGLEKIGQGAPINNGYMQLCISTYYQYVFILILWLKFSYDWYFNWFVILINQLQYDFFFLLLIITYVNSKLLVKCWINEVYLCTQVLHPLRIMRRRNLTCGILFIFITLFVY